MNKAKVRQRGIFMAYNLVAFTLIFSLFSSIIYGQINSSLFSSVVEDLEYGADLLRDNSDFVDYQVNFTFDRPPQEGGPFEPERVGGPGPEGNISHLRMKMSMRIQTLVRDGAGGIVNGQTLGRIYMEGLIGEIPFSPDSLDHVTAFHLDGSSYRSLAFRSADSAGDPYYVQLILNVDAEQSIMDNLLRILILCAAVFVSLSIMASYFLSQRSMIPLLKSWNRQTEFVANASHELRTPLTIIQNKLESLFMEPRSTILDRADDIAISLSETRRLSKLTSDLMTLARADSSETQLEREQLHLDQLIREVSEPYGELAEMQGKKLALRLEHGGTLEADRNRIHELMVILLDNALKYTKEGGEITVSTLVREGRPVIEVADTGIGIPEESLNRIFERFYREEKARSRESGGSGLGLSIARWIVEAHGGSIRAMPNRPQGAAFQVKL